MSIGSAIGSAGSSGGGYSDFNSLGGIHYGAGLANMSDPLNILGGSGSNIGANMTNPFGSGLINGNMPNNGVNPLEAARWAGTQNPTLPNPLFGGKTSYNPNFTFSPVSNGGNYNAMANGLAQSPGTGGYNAMVNSLMSGGSGPFNAQVAQMSQAPAYSTPTLLSLKPQVSRNGPMPIRPRGGLLQ